VTDDKDRRTLTCILKRFYSKRFLDEEHEIVPGGVFICPPDGSRDDYLSFIDGLPMVAAPSVFGFHDNATLTRDQNDTNSLLLSVLETEGGDEGDEEEGGMSKEEVIASTAMEIADKIPANFDMEMAQLKYPVLWEESMNTVLCQELIRFNKLLSCIRSSLINIQKAVKGLVVMSSELEVLANSLFFNKLPVMWKNKSYPSLKPLASYVTDLQVRLRFFDTWLQTAPPSVYWLSGFFFTQAFLTGSSQNFARKYTIPIDDVVFDFEMKKEPQYENGPDNGVYTYGLFLEGSRWDPELFGLAESLPKILFSPAPIIHFVPYRTAEIPQYSHYNCPVYKTSDRRGILATTGHSSNFVCFIKVPSDIAQEHWVERGVAMLTQLDD
jgi:dynein heavy chain